MQITLESTTQITELVINGASVPARLWQGETDSGVKVHAFITRIAVDDGDNSVATEIFERELRQCAPPRPEYRAYDARFFLD